MFKDLATFRKNTADQEYLSTLTEIVFWGRTQRTVRPHQHDNFP